MSAPRLAWYDPGYFANGATRPIKNSAADERGESTRFRGYSIAELAALVPPPPLIDGVLFQGGMSAIVARYDSYKSFLGLSEALCVGKGIDWFGYNVTRGHVVYYAGESPHGFPKRINAWCALNRLPDAGDVTFVTDSLKLNDSRDLADFLAFLRGLSERPRLIILDTFARTLRGNENSAEDTGLYVEAIDAIRQATGAHVQVIHHTGWENDRSRGSSNIPASLDTELTLTRDDDRVTITCTKQKDAEPFAPITLERVEIAGSLAFQRFAPTSAKLSANERETLRVVQGSGPIRTTPWLEAAGIPRRSFFNAKKRLETLAYVRETKDGHEVTDAGRQVK